jgi:hypothetical protein
MGQTSSRQIKDLVPLSRITKELGRPKADSCQLLVVRGSVDGLPPVTADRFHFRLATLRLSVAIVSNLTVSIVTNSRGLLDTFPKIISIVK